MYTIKEITANDTFFVRHPVLRNGKPIASCHFDGDTLPTTLHFGIFATEKLIGVISLFKNHHSFFQEVNQIQIRGMAVLEEFQRKGFGEKLISHCEGLLKNEANGLLWFNARSNAVGFYEKLGYKIIGTSFEITDVGTHFVMYKNV
jgi:ribosomal protein S18 acetylase RimI-like enzyme